MIGYLLFQILTFAKEDNGEVNRNVPVGNNETVTKEIVVLLQLLLSHFGKEKSIEMLQTSKT